jgi:hypothetical protein
VLGLASQVFIHLRLPIAQEGIKFQKKSRRSEDVWNKIIVKVKDIHFY